MEEGRTRTLVLGDARGGGRFLRVTWHPQPGTVVFSHWSDGVCTASTPVELSEASRLVDLLAGALRDAIGSTSRSSADHGADDPTLLQTLSSVVERARRYLRPLSERLPGPSTADSPTTVAPVLRLPERDPGAARDDTAQL